MFALQNDVALGKRTLPPALRATSLKEGGKGERGCLGLHSGAGEKICVLSFVDDAVYFAYGANVVGKFLADLTAVS